MCDRSFERVHLPRLNETENCLYANDANTVGSFVRTGSAGTVVQDKTPTHLGVENSVFRYLGTDNWNLGFRLRFFANDRHGLVVESCRCDRYCWSGSWVSEGYLRCFYFGFQIQIFGFNILIFRVSRR